MSQSYSSPTTNAGIALPSAGCPDYEAGNAVALLAAAVSQLDSSLFGITKYTAAGAIAFGNGGSGVAALKAGSAAAMTLANPVVGLPSAGGQDGTRLTIIAEDAFAYTVTTGTNGLNSSKHVATFAAAVGDNIELIAHSGSWWQVGTPLGVTLS